MAWTPSPAALAAITAGVVAAGVGAGLLLQPTKDPAAPATRGPGVNIAVVAPREPVPEPGGVMDVGDLADGYRHRDYAGQADDYPLPRDDFEDEPRADFEPGRAGKPPEPAFEPAPAPVVVERRERPRRWPFGFDQPAPDYAAERRERRARLDDARRFDEARPDDRFDDRGYDRAPRDDRDREAPVDRDRGGRERQWYSGDGRPVAGPDGPD